jgi:hypothetical protein
MAKLMPVMNTLAFTVLISKLTSSPPSAATTAKPMDSPPAPGDWRTAAGRRPLVVAAGQQDRDPHPEGEDGADRRVAFPEAGAERGDQRGHDQGPGQRVGHPFSITSPRLGHGDRGSDIGLIQVRVGGRAGQDRDDLHVAAADLDRDVPPEVLPATTFTIPGVTGGCHPRTRRL